MMISSTGISNYSSGGMSGIWSRSSSSGTNETTSARPDPAEIFSKADEDGSGGLDQTEFETLLSKMNKASNTSLDVEAMFATYDADEDGVLNEEETQTAMEANRPQGPPPPPPHEGIGGIQGSSETDLSQLFSEADEDGNGRIDETEFQTLAEKLSGSTETSSSEGARSALISAMESYSNMAFLGMGQNQVSGLSSFLASEASSMNLLV